MQIGNNSYTLSTQMFKSGNESPLNFNGKQASFKQEDNLKISVSSTPKVQIEKGFESSSIDELEVYFEERLARLASSGGDPSSLLELRDSIRAAAENKNGDSPPLPTVIDHPYGDKSLGNVHLSFGSEVTKGELQSLTNQLPYLKEASNLKPNLKIMGDLNASTNIDTYKNNKTFSQDDLALRELAERIDPENMNRNEARYIATSLDMSTDIQIDNAFLLQSMVLVNENGSLRNATESDAIMNERFNMFDALKGAIQFNKEHGLSSTHLEEGLQQLEKIKAYRDNPQVSVYS